MNKIQDYNIKLLNALHSWFWYNGLLEKLSLRGLLFYLSIVFNNKERK